MECTSEMTRSDLPTDGYSRKPLSPNKLSDYTLAPKDPNVFHILRRKQTGILSSLRHSFPGTNIQMAVTFGHQQETRAGIDCVQREIVATINTSGVPDSKIR